MAWFARFMYNALAWKERQYAKRSQGLAEREAVAAEDTHLETGERGENLAYWYLRQAGYVMVARNLRLRRGGELDLVGWDGPILAFVEVKTRTSDAAGTAQEAVTRGQQKRIVRGAQEYLRRLSSKAVNYRFDIASVSWDPETGYGVQLIKDAFKS